jgi:hypothetical protein
MLTNPAEFLRLDLCFEKCTGRPGFSRILVIRYGGTAKQNMLRSFFFLAHCNEEKLVESSKMSAVRDKRTCIPARARPEQLA